MTPRGHRRDLHRRLRVLRAQRRLPWPRRNRSRRGRDQGYSPCFRYQPIAGPEETGNGGRIRWVSGRPGEAAAYAGTDFTISRDGRIAALISFSTSYPELDFAPVWPSCGRSLENGFCRRVLPVESWLLPSGQSLERDREESTVTFCRTAEA